jgi:hypothetical protein
MIEGWHNDDYLILCEDQSETNAMTERYAIVNYLPDYMILGLKSWDDFIVCDARKQFFTVPSVPLDAKYLQPFGLKFDVSKLLPDPRLPGKIRWFIKPLVFGGDPSAESNTKWITLDEHVEAVKWWNELYRDVQRRK